MDREHRGADPSTIAVAELSLEQPRASIATMGQVYARAAQLLQHGAAPPEGIGYRLFWSMGGDLQSHDLGAGADSYVIIGRHTKCDVRLGDDDSLSLRHLLARPVIVDDAVMLAILDLRGGLSFFLDDDTPHRSIIANGPLAFRLGRYVVCAIPLGTGRELAFNRALAAPAQRRFRPDLSSASMPSYRFGSEAELHSPAASATSYVGPSTQLVRRRGVSSIDEVIQSGEPGSAQLVVSSKDRSVPVLLSNDDLAEGVLVGRSERCLDRGITRVLSDQISRAHLLIMKSGDRVEAFDLCSTNGTREGKQRVRHVVLPDAGTTLRLGKHVAIAYSRRPEE